MKWHRVELSEEQELELRVVFRSTRDRRLRDRCQAVLMAAQRRSKASIASALGVTPWTVTNWLKLYASGGIEGLHIQWGTGRTPLIDEALAPEIVAWVQEGPSGCGLNRANWTFEELSHHLYREKGIRVSEWCMREFCHRHGIRPYRPSYQYLRGDEAKQEKAREELAELKKKAEAGELVLLSQDEARFPLVPTLCRTLGVKGHRPQVGTWDNKDLVYAFAALNLVTGQVHTKLVDSPKDAKKKTGKSKPRRLQAAFAAFLFALAAAYPRTQHRRVVIVIDNASWHGGEPIREALSKNPHLEFYRLPSYSPQLNVIERFWKILRRRATHNRLFDSMKELRTALRASLCYYQTLRHKVLSLIYGKRGRKQEEEAEVIELKIDGVLDGESQLLESAG